MDLVGVAGCLGSGCGGEFGGDACQLAELGVVDSDSAEPVVEGTGRGPGVVGCLAGLGRTQGCRRVGWGWERFWAFALAAEVGVLGRWVAAWLVETVRPSAQTLV